MRNTSATILVESLFSEGRFFRWLTLTQHAIYCDAILENLAEWSRTSVPSWDPKRAFLLAQQSASRMVDKGGRRGVGSGVEWRHPGGEILPAASVIDQRAVSKSSKDRRSIDCAERISELEQLTLQHSDIWKKKFKAIQNHYAHILLSEDGFPHVAVEGRIRHSHALCLYNGIYRFIDSVAKNRSVNSSALNLLNRRKVMY